MNRSTSPENLSTLLRIPASDSNPHRCLPQTGTFRKEGEYWTLGIGGRVFPLRDAKGLAYLAHILPYPGWEVHVVDLAAGISDSSSGGDTERMPRGGQDLQKAVNTRGHQLYPSSCGSDDTLVVSRRNKYLPWLSRGKEGDLNGSCI